MTKPVILCVDDEPLILEALKTELRTRFPGRFSYETALDGGDHRGAGGRRHYHRAHRF